MLLPEKMGEAWEPSKTQCYFGHGELLVEKYTYLDFNPQPGQRGCPKADGSKSQVTNWALPQDELADRPSVATGL